MAFEGAQLGNMLGALFPPDQIKHYLDELAKQQQDLSTGQLGINRGLNNANLAAYNKNASDAASAIRGLSDDDMALYRSMAGNLAASDPLGLRNQLAQSNYNLFDQYAKRVGSQTNLNDNLRSARLGYGGTGPSTYTTALIADRTAKNLSPALASLLGNLGSETNSLLANRRADYGAADAAINARAAVPTRALQLDLAPITARNSALGSELDLIGKGLQNYKQNYLGTEIRDQPFVGFTKAADKSINSIVDTGLSVYTGGLYNGGGGSGGGAGGGSGGITSMLGGLMGGGGGGGGGQNNQQVMQLLLQLLGGGNGYQAPGGGSGYLANYAMPNYGNPIGYDYGRSTGG